LRLQFWLRQAYILVHPCQFNSDYDSAETVEAAEEWKQNIGTQVNHFLMDSASQFHQIPQL